MSKPPAQTLACTQCGYDNEPERVYCHNCGTKLDRSLLPKETEAAQEETLAAARKRIRKMTQPGRVTAEIKAGLNSLTWAALVATFYLLLSPPSRPPLPRSEEMGRANIISGVIEDKLASPTATVSEFSEADLSQHAGSRLRGTPVIPGLDFQRAYVQLDDNRVTLGIQQALYGYSLFTTVDYRAAVVDGKLTATKVGQHFGRLGIHPAIPKMDSFMQTVWGKLKREREFIERTQAITIRKDRVVITLKPAAPQR
ncbi:MAG: zinc ribbon domain-containing protein [Chthoniobacteraceae bacterium]